MSKFRGPAPSTLNQQSLLAAEHGPALAWPDGWPGGGRLGVALVYPNTYHVGMSSLGYQIAWQTINLTPGARAERFFTDTMAGGSIETGAPLSDFDVIAFSGAYEMDDPNVLDVLEQAGLPLEARHRDVGNGASGRVSTHRDDWPLVLMGGVLISVNRLPLYPFIDVFAHGEAECLLPPLLDRLLSACDSGAGRADLLLSLMELPGLEVTAGARAAAGLPVPGDLAPLLDVLDRDPGDNGILPRPPAPERAIMADIRDTPATTTILTPHTEFSNMALVDLARGCPHHCTFCWIGHNAPVYRVRPMDVILAEIERLAAHTDRFGLVASAVGAHPEIDAICQHLMDHGRRVSYSSLRVEEVSDTMLRALAAGGQKSVTIAPEAGAIRVRRLLGKKISDEQIFAVTEQIFGLGAENLKLYFMTGIPSETDEEALEIAVFTEKIRQIQLRHARPRGRVGTIGINLGIFVPKPDLPLNKIEPSEFAAVRKRLKLVIRALERIPNTHVNVSSPELARAQAVLSMGGVDAAHYLLALRQCGGDWREANRHWRARGDDRYAWRTPESRLAAATLRQRTAPH